MGVTMDVALDGFNRCCSGCYDRMGVKTAYTGQEDQETLVDTKDSIFCEFDKQEGRQLWCPGRSVEFHKIHLNSTKNTSATFTFVRNNLAS